MRASALVRSWRIPSWFKQFRPWPIQIELRMPPVLQSLTSVALGQKATVVEIKLPPESRPRLMEMGLLVGTLVELIRFAPLGDPVEIKVRGYNLTLRRHEAEQIFVRPSSQQ